MYVYIYTHVPILPINGDAHPKSLPKSLIWGGYD